jgi:hypothetical protein
MENLKKLRFGLFPDELLLVSLHTDVPDADNVAKNILSMEGNKKGEKYAIIDANLIMSMKQVAIAANNALLRMDSNKRIVELKKVSGGESQPTMTSRRGKAIETVVCAGGSSHVGSVLREYAFDGEEKITNGNTNNLLVLGFDCTEEDFRELLRSSGLDKNGPVEMDCFWSREKSEELTNKTMKLYKVTADEICLNGSLLEDAIITRISSKYVM